MSAATFKRSLETVSKHLKPGWFSRRAHGSTEPNRGTVVNTRDKINRNRRVSVNGDTARKFKRTEVYRLPIPHKVVKT